MKQFFIVSSTFASMSVVYSHVLCRPLAICVVLNHSHMYAQGSSSTAIAFQLRKSFECICIQRIVPLFAMTPRKSLVAYFSDSMP